MEVHKVVAPPHRSTAAKLKTRLKETFFPDDPLRQFRGQPNRTKLIRAAQYIFPILQWCPVYSFRLLKSDVVSGLTIASLAIPQVHNTFSGERICKIRRWPIASSDKPRVTLESKFLIFSPKLKFLSFFLVFLKNRE